MSFSVSCGRHGLEYAGRRPLGRAPLRLVREIVRFLREARGTIERAREQTLGAYVTEHGYSAQFRDHFLVPLTAAIWSSGTGAALEFPAGHALRSLDNHGMLGYCGGANGHPTITYYLNRLQRLDTDEHYGVTLNRTDEIDEERVIRRIPYEHPLFTFDSLRAQAELPGLNRRRTAFAGAWQGFGFHEDGLASGLRAAAAFRGEVVRSGLYTGAVMHARSSWRVRCRRMPRRSARSTRSSVRRTRSSGRRDSGFAHRLRRRPYRSTSSCGPGTPPS